MDNNDNSNPLRHLTIPARLMVIVAIFFFPVGTALLICSVYDGFPSGSYPIMFFALPVLIGMFFFVVIGLQILRLLGIPVYLSEQDRKQDQQKDKSDTERE